MNKRYIQPKELKLALKFMREVNTQRPPDATLHFHYLMACAALVAKYQDRIVVMKQEPK